MEKTPKVAYFCMEFGLDSEFKIYSGGLGILAGDVLKASKDSGLPVIGVGILWRAGLGDQYIDCKSNFPYDCYREYKYDYIEDTGITVDVTIRHFCVKVKVWKCNCFGNNTLYLLDTFLPGNPYNLITGNLYGWFNEERIAQEIILGIGGYRALKALGLSPDIYHFNDSHPILCATELIKEQMAEKKVSFKNALKSVRNKIVFTTHTPVIAGNEVHDHKLLNYMHAYNGLTYENMKYLGGDPFSMTAASLRVSKIANAVAELHCNTAKKMWADVDNAADIINVTNGVHNGTWQDAEVAEAYLSKKDIYSVHQSIKRKLIAEIKKRNNIQLDENILTIGFAKRTTAYKRSDLIFKNPEFVEKLFKANKLQIIFSGKAHPNDFNGKAIVSRLFLMSKKYPSNVIFIENYDMQIGKLLTRGCDIWLNNPIRPMEACGTSGMKAAMNGVLNFAVLDGWWPEGCIDGVNGWQIGNGYEGSKADIKDSESLYKVLTEKILPLYENDKDKWQQMMRESIKMSEYMFSAKRMMEDYYDKIYTYQLKKN